MNFKSILAILILVGDLFVLIWLISFAGFINFSKFSISYLVGCFVIALIWGLFGFLDEKRLEKSFKKNYFKVNYIKLIPLLFYIIIGILSLHWINHPYIIGLITAKFIITHFIFISP